MSIQKKIVLLTTLWLIGILLAVNVTVYFAFLRITTQNEKDLFMNRVHTLLEKADPADLISGKSTELLQSYLPDQGMIRLLDKEGKVVQTVQNDSDLLPLKTETIKHSETEVYYRGESAVLLVRVPIHSGSDTIGSIEMAEKLDPLEDNIRILISILALSSLGAIGLSLIGGVYLSRWILRPISGMVRTMEQIEKSLAFHRIPLSEGSKDELGALAATFNRMIDRLEENFVRQQQFVSDASHELKTPLTIIEGYANMLRRWGLKDEAKGKEAVESIHSEAVRMKQMTQQLLDLASSEQERILKVENVELVTVCEQTARLLSKTHRREIEVISSSKEITAEVDASTVNQLLLILLDNAIKYSKDKIELHVSEKTDPVSGKHGVEIRVKDYGIGIPQEELSRVFERFYRVDSSRHRKTGGTGLGLAIAKNMIRHHGGTIDLASEVNAGTEVIVFIPSL
ncbi:ATP-binding protein [Paenibacillus chitinolyticus]|uniref:HAMP domain-containing sensor histidine kinase n=1 Tax=Paenibacillus chitinolyticus TaxID=79263 RepID=UPI003864CDC9